MRLPPGDRRRLAVGLDDFRPYAGCLAPATAPPAARVSGSLFEGNVASAAGGAVVVRSGALSLADSEVLGNAVTGSAASKLPLGASSIALRELAAAAAEEEEEEAAPAGGGAPPSPSLASLFGGIPLLDSSLSSPPAGNPRARGGGVFVGGSCGASGTCTSARAVLSGVKVSGNSAAEAGGGVFYEGTSSPAAALVVSGGEVRGNRAPEASAGGGGVGGGVALVGRGFSLDGVAVSANAARFGGGLFVSADLSLGAAAAQGAGEGSRNATLSSISFGAAAAAAAADVASSSVAGEATVLDGNAGARGRDVFWLRAASPAAALACAGCSFSDAAAAQAAPATAPAPPPAPSTGPVSSASSSPFKNASSYSSSSSSSLYYSSPALALSPPEGALATEAITAALETSSSSSSSSSPSSSAFASVQSGSPAPAFAVSLLDFYGQVSTTDGGGSCEVAEEAGPEAGGGSQGAPPGRGPPRRRRRREGPLRPLRGHGGDRLRGLPPSRVRPLSRSGEAGAPEPGAQGERRRQRRRRRRRRRSGFVVVVVVDFARRRPPVAPGAAAQARGQRVRPRDAGPPARVQGTLPGLLPLRLRDLLVRRGEPLRALPRR